MIKLIFAEDGSDVAAELWDRANTVAASQLIYPEARAAAAAARRDGRIDARALRGAVETIDDLCSELVMIGVDEALARAAGELAQEYRLRGYDAVHLASAVAIEDPGLVVATWDGDLASAAIANRFVVASGR